MLERRTPGELEVYPQIVAIAHAIIAEAFSNQVDHAGRHDDRGRGVVDARAVAPARVHQLVPAVGRRSSGRRTARYKDSHVIHRGDLLHCDFGIVYLNLCTDTQQQAYVLKEGETDAPKGLEDGLALGNRLQDIHMEEMKVGRTGNQVLAAALKRAKAEGLRPSIYSHPLGVHGHAAGAPVGMMDKQDGVPGEGDYPFFADTVHSIELNTTPPCPSGATRRWRSRSSRTPCWRRTASASSTRRQTTTAADSVSNCQLSVVSWSAGLRTRDGGRLGEPAP